MARQFGLLERLGAVTIVLAEAVGQEAAKYPNSSGADAFVQVARALRQTIALERRIEAERDAGERREADRRQAVEPRRAGTFRHAAVPDDAADDATDHAGHQAAGHPVAGHPVAGHPVDDGVAAVTRENLLGDLHDRPDRRDAVDELRGLPTGEVVGRICQMLGIEADLSCFTDQEMGRRAAMNHPPLPRPPAPLSNAEFEAALARPSHGQPGLIAPMVRRGSRLPPDAARGSGGHDPPYAKRC